MDELAHCADATAQSATVVATPKANGKPIESGRELIFATVCRGATSTRHRIGHCLERNTTSYFD
jgi:hypothetical protein